MKHDKPYDKSVYRALILVTQISINLLVPICLMTLLGWYLDEKLDTVFITVVLFCVGAIAGGQNAYKLIMQSMKEEEQSQRNTEDSGRDRPGTNNPKKSSGWMQSGAQEVEGAEHPDGSME